MDRRQSVVIAAISTLLCVLPGCGSSDESTDHAGVDFQGLYQPTNGGDIDAITFENGSYTLVPEGCSSASCAELGTYAIDDSATKLELRSKDGRTKTLPLKVLETTGAASRGGAKILGGILGDPASIANDTGTIATGSSSMTNGSKPITNGSGNALINDVIEMAVVGAEQLAKQRDNTSTPTTQTPTTQTPTTQTPAATQPAATQPGATQPGAAQPTTINCKDDVPTDTSTQEEIDAYYKQCPEGPSTK